MTAAPGSAAPSEAPVVVLTRDFAAPRELVFAAWTQAEHFARWFAPRTYTVTVAELDARPGGALRFCHHAPDGEDAWVSGEYSVVTPPERLELTLGFSDAAGNRVERPGFALESRITVTFAESGGRTEVHVEHYGLRGDQGESQGWSESLDKLASLVERGGGQ